ncbi:hypothetical protein [Microcystis phage Mvi-JY20]|uniref:Uncharacterized protein n=1 Tax=Microcystis phage Mvi-JY20 TaxID=3128146 RepID=A0AAX4QGM6_9CAUD
MQRFLRSLRFALAPKDPVVATVWCQRRLFRLMRFREYDTYKPLFYYQWVNEDNRPVSDTYIHANVALMSFGEWWDYSIVLLKTNGNDVKTASVERRGQA